MFTPVIQIRNNPNYNHKKTRKQTTSKKSQTEIESEVQLHKILLGDVRKKSNLKSLCVLIKSGD